MSPGRLQHRSVVGACRTRFLGGSPPGWVLRCAEKGAAARSGVTSAHAATGDGRALSPTMTPQARTTNSQDLPPDPAGYQVDDLIIDLASQRVRRAGTVIPLQALSFDLLVTLVRAAPNLLSFEQLTERVWPGLVIAPETIVQRVKLVRSALGDDPRAPRYIAGVRGRGYRLVAQVRPIAEPRPPAESIVPVGLEDKTEADSPSVRASAAATEAVAASPSSATPPAPPRPAK